MGQPVRCTVRPVPRRMARRVRTATALPWARARTATSTRARTGTHTRTPEAGGAETRTTPRKPARRDGAGRKKAAGHRPLAAGAAAGGELDPPVPEVRPVWAAGDVQPAQTASTLRIASAKPLVVNILEDCYVVKNT